MGLEARCTLRLGRESFSGQAHLDSDRVTFRGGTKIAVSFGEIVAATATTGGKLRLDRKTGRVELEFANQATAATWCEKIRHPRSLVDKLGFRPDSRVAVVGVTDPEFAKQLKERLQSPAGKALRPALDYIVYAAETRAQLAQLNQLKTRLQPAGAIWVVARKGRAATLKDTDVMHAARAAGLVDVKVCSFSATHTALKLVIPKAAR